MENENPHSAPDVLIPSSPPPASPLPNAPSPLVIDELARTRPWVRFLSIATWIGTLFFLSAALFLYANAGKELEGARQVGQALFYGLLGLALMYPALKLGHYASKIGDLVRSRTMGDLEKALLQQRLVWKFYGILTAIYLLIALLGLILIGVTVLKL